MPDPRYFWPRITLSNDLFLKAHQAIQDARNQQGPYCYKPDPPPDHIPRTVKRLVL